MSEVCCVTRHGYNNFWKKILFLFPESDEIRYVVDSE